MKEKVLSPNMGKKLSRLEGRKLQDSSCDSIEVLWSMELPVTQITQQANSKSKMLRNKIKSQYLYRCQHCRHTHVLSNMPPGLVRHAISFLPSYSFFLFSKQDDNCILQCQLQHYVFQIITHSMS